MFTFTVGDIVTCWPRFGMFSWVDSEHWEGVSGSHGLRAYQKWHGYTICLLPPWNSLASISSSTTLSIQHFSLKDTHLGKMTKLMS